MEAFCENHRHTSLCIGSNFPKTKFPTKLICVRALSFEGIAKLSTAWEQFA